MTYPGFESHIRAMEKFGYQRVDKEKYEHHVDGVVEFVLGEIKHATGMMGVNALAEDMIPYLRRMVWDALEQVNLDAFDTAQRAESSRTQRQIGGMITGLLHAAQEGGDIRTAAKVLNFERTGEWLKDGESD
jgi:hypothetical protein